MLGKKSLKKIKKWEKIPLFIFKMNLMVIQCERGEKNKMFKVGNKVRYKLKQAVNKARFGQCAKVIDVQSNGDLLVRWDDGTFGGVDTTYIRGTSFELAKGGKVKADDMVRYMAYGVGCDNKGSFRETEKELKEDLREFANDRVWSGDLIGYKLVPLYRAEKNVRLKLFKAVKITKFKKTKKK